MKTLTALATLALLAPALTTRADTTPQTLPFSQNWTTTTLITTNNDWASVPGIVGYLGANTLSAPIDPATVLGDFTDVNVIAQTTPSNSAGGVGEMDALANPCVALQASNTADNPFLLLHLNTTGWQNLLFACNLRDVDATTDNAVQPISIQYRVGNSGNFTALELPGDRTADATTGPSQATLVTAKSILLPAAANNQPLVQIRIMTANAVGNDEWVGIDDISVTGAPLVFTVTNTNDSGPGSLRAALATAAAQPGADTIVFDPALNAKTIVVTGPSNGSAFDLASGEVVTVDASALSAGVKIDGGMQGFRFFKVNTGASLTLRGLTLANGGGASFIEGGAIYNGGTLTLTACTLSGNRAGAGAVGASGGAILNFQGTATLTYCTLSNNLADGAGGAGGAIGNAHSSAAPALLTLNHCTLSGNSAGSNGGAISSLSGGTTTLTHCTFSSNSTNSSGGAIANAGPMTLTNSIVGGNTAASGPDISNGFGNTLTLVGTNLVQTAIAGTGTVTGSGTINTTAPLLATLGNYGGPTQTRPPLSTSPAINAAPLLAGQTVDQRGVTRTGAVPWTNDFSSNLNGAVAYGSGALVIPNFRLTQNLSDQSGTLVLPDLGGLTNFTASFDYIFYDPEGVPADGFSFCFGPNPGGAVNDVGDGVNHVVRFDIYAGGNPPQGIISYRNVSTVTSNSTALHRFNDQIAPQPITITLRGGKLTVRYKGNIVLNEVPSSYTYTPGDRIFFGSRTGGSSAEQRIDNLSVAGLTDIGAVQALSGPVNAVVTSNADNGPGTLRDILTAVPTGSTITFDPAVFTGATPTTNTIALTTSQFSTAITLAKAVTIDATAIPGGVKLDGNSQNFQFFYVNTGASLTLHGLTLTRGGGANFSSFGGAIDNRGTLTLTRCTLSGNQSVFRSDGDAGAIYNRGTATLTDCTLFGNSAGANGGAIESTGTLTLTHCTLSGNTCGSYGGGICNASDATTLTHCTLSGNTAPAGQGSGVASFGDANTLTVVQNCIISGNTNSSVDVPVGTGSINSFTSLGHNLIGPSTTTTAFNVAGNIVSDTPQIAPLGNYGGPTQTLALLPNSPARNAATVLAQPITSDQRGFSTIGTPDIGAYEAGTFTNYNAWIYETLPTTTIYAWNAAVPDAQHASNFDFDGDGVTNGNEWIARTAPGNATDYLRITSAVRSGANVILTFPSVTGRTYTLWQSDTLSGAWTDTGQAAVSGNGSPKTFTAPAPVNGIPKRFYRVQVGP